MKENKMNGWIYSLWAKCLAILMTIIMALTAGSGACLIFGGLSYMSADECWNGTPYKGSTAMAKWMMEASLETLSSESGSKQLLKDGVFDPDQTVDILNYAAGIGNPDKADATTYKLSDLVKYRNSEAFSRLKDHLNSDTDDEEFFFNRIENEYSLQSYYVAEDGTCFGTCDLDVIVSTTDAMNQEAGTEDVPYTAESQHPFVSQNLFIIDTNHYVHPYQYGGDTPTTLKSVSREEMMVRLLDLSDAPEEFDVSQYYGVYGETFCYLYATCKSLETVLPLSGMSIANYALTHPYNFSIRDAYWNLVDATEYVYQSYLSADKVVEPVDGTELSGNEGAVQASEARFQVYLIDHNKNNVLTNLPLQDNQDGAKYWTLFQQSAAYLQEEAPYAYFSRNGDQYDLQTPDYMSEDARDTICTACMKTISEYASSGSNYTFYVLWNPSVTLENNGGMFDVLGLSVSKAFRIGVWCTLFGSILFLFNFILCFAQVGRRYGETDLDGEGKKLRHASGFIREIPICLLIGIYAILWGIWATFFAVLCENYLKSRWFIIMGEGVAAAAVALLLWTLLSLAAKIKTHTMLNHCIIRGMWRLLARSVKGIYLGRKAVGKILLVYGGFTLLALLGLMDLNGIGFILLLIAWGGLLAFLIYKAIQRQQVLSGVERIATGNLESQINEDKLSGDEKVMARHLNNVKNGLQLALDEQMKSERMKTDLITNVSHDIKTPLTSIINYVDLLKRQKIEDETIAGYIDVLDKKSARLKHLTEDLVEASKISSGNITLECVNLDLKQLIMQTNGEFQEKFEERNLEMVCELPENPMIIYADGRRVFRILENLYNNAAKYSMPGSRVYIKGDNTMEGVVFSMKNISEQALNFSAEELMERFVRGDVSRSTEGSGLGLEIARNLTTIQNGTFDLYVDGDLFKVTLGWKHA